MSASEVSARRARDLRTRYTVADLDVLSAEEARRFVPAGAGNPQAETLRLAGNTLLWEQDGVTFRLEAQVSRDDALRIAASFR